MGFQFRAAILVELGEYVAVHHMTAHEAGDVAVVVFGVVQDRFDGSGDASLPGDPIDGLPVPFGDGFRRVGVPAKFFGVFAPDVLVGKYRIDLLPRLPVQRKFRFGA